MALEKILVGDDQIEFAREKFPSIPNVEVEFVNNPDDLIQRAKTSDYSIIVTDLNYTENGQEGYKVLGALKDINTRKILWTGNAYDKGVKEKAQSLGAEVLDKDEIGTLVGQAINKAPLKQDGKILVYVAHSDPIRKALEMVLSQFFTPDQLSVSSDLKNELLTDQYGLVIDTSTMLQWEKRVSGVVAHDMKYIKLNEVPRVVTVHDVTEVLADILKIGGAYLNK